MDILTFLGITAGLVASMVTITVGSFQIGAMVRKQKHRKALEKHQATIAKTSRKELPKTT